MNFIINKYLTILLLVSQQPLLCQIHNPRSIEEIYFQVYKGNKTGIVNSNGEIIIPLEYSYLSVSDTLKNILIGGKENTSTNDTKYGAFNLENQIVIPFEFYRLNNWQSTNRIVGTIKSINGKEFQKTFNTKGIEVFPTGIKNGWFFNDTIAKVKNGNGEYLIDTKKQKVTKEYSRIHKVVNGMIKFREGDLSGYLDSSYKEIIPAKYDWFASGYFNKDGLANVRLEDEWTEAIIKKDGSEIFNIGKNFRYHDDYRKENFLLAYKVDPNGDNSSYEHCLFDFNNENLIFNFGPSMAGAGYEVFKDKISFWGRPMYKDYYELTIISKEGRILSKTKTPLVNSETKNTLITIEKEDGKNKYRIISKDGSSHLKVTFDSIIGLSNVYDNTTIFLVKNKNKFGVIDINGKVILDIKYDGITRINTGELAISTQNEYFLYSTQGDPIIKNSKYQIIEAVRLNKDWFIVKFEDKLGVYNFKKEIWIIKPEFTKIKPTLHITSR